MSDYIPLSMLRAQRGIATDHAAEVKRHSPKVRTKVLVSHVEGHLFAEQGR